MCWSLDEYKKYHVFSLKCGIVTDEEKFTIMSTSLENKEVKELRIES